jgi:hypothetical protein
MSEGRSDVGQRDSEIRQNVLACLRKRERRALFVTELTAALRKAHGTSASAMEQALAALEADWTVVIRDHYCADPHLEGADLRVVALVESSVGEGAQGGEEAQMQAIREIEATWHEWLAEYMANHRCS